MTLLACSKVHVKGGIGPYPLPANEDIQLHRFAMGTALLGDGFYGFGLHGLRLQAEPRLAGSLAEQETVPDEVKAAIVLFLSTLDEKQRRLYAGLESLKFCYGGDQRIADFIGMDAHTVGKGRRQLLDQDPDLERIRKAGAGRKPAEKKRPKSSPGSKS